jgi:hypothetical protein
MHLLVHLVPAGALQHLRKRRGLGKELKSLFDGGKEEQSGPWGEGERGAAVQHVGGAAAGGRVWALCSMQVATQGVVNCMVLIPLQQKPSA